MKRLITKQQRNKLRELGIKETLYNVSSIDSLISNLPTEISGENGKTYRLSFRNLGERWCVQYVDFNNGERLLGYVWFAKELVDALYKAVKFCAIYSRKVYNTNKTN